MVAENIGAGDRSFLNIQKIPEISAGQAHEAVRDLVQAGVVSVTEDRVEPTAGFSDWLADLRKREDAPRTCRPEGQHASPQVQSPRGDAPAPANNYGRDARPVTGHGALRGGSDRRRHPASSSRRPHEAALAIRVLERVAGRKLDHTDVGRPVHGEMPMAQLRRSLNAYRFPEWEDAIELCKRLGAVSIDVGDLVKPRTAPARLFPPPPRVKRSAGRHRTARDKAARQAWVEKKRRERGEDPDEDEPRDDIKEWLASLQTS